MKTLNTPPLLIGSALALWGWQSGFLLVSLLMAVILEGSRVVGLRWDLKEKDFRRIWDFTTVLFLATAVYLFTGTEGPGSLVTLMMGGGPGAQGRAVSETAQAMLVLFRWLPLVFFLFVAAQAYSNTELIPWSVLSIVVRRRLARQKDPLPSPPHQGLNMGNRYLAVCLLASCVPVRPGNEFFYPLFGLLVAWALWNRRPLRYSFASWAALVLLVLVAGYFAQNGFRQIVGLANVYGTNWLAQFLNRGFDPRETRTALGQIGRIKLSGKVVLRVESKDNRPAPPLLREASYRFFRFPDWAGAGRVRDFVDAQYETNATTWVLAPGAKAEHAITISQYLPERSEEGARRGVLALPHGIVRIENLHAFVVSTNRLGVVRVDEGPGLVVYDAWYKSGSTLDSPPDERDDLSIPKSEEAALTQIVNELGVAGKTPREILRALTAFFFNHFEYSSWLPSAHRLRLNLTPLSNFLLSERRGHCEYFATAATLLLRKAGVPARYAVGYAVHEKSGRTYLVRQRHAHAWCLVWVDGRWQDFDPTPGSWIPAEDSRAAWTEWLSDWWSRIWFEFSRWRWGEARIRDYLVWAALPVLALLLVRLALTGKWRRQRRKKVSLRPLSSLPGADSEFYLVQQEAARRGLLRQPDETPRDWWRRLERETPLARWRDSFETMLRLHYRYRFDPAGLLPGERAQLREGAQECLRRLRARPQP